VKNKAETETGSTSQFTVRPLHREIKDVWRAYLRGQLLLMLSVGVLTGLGKEWRYSFVTHELREVH
jgi:predicted PurR-regulated permease PerM